MFVFFISISYSAFIKQAKSQTGPLYSISTNDYAVASKRFRSSFFAGKINNIEDVESGGYTCDKQGVVVTIKLNSKSIKYFIPNGV